MRSMVFLVPFLLLGFCAGQSTDFPVGPQYLISGSTLFLRPLATPTMSLGEGLPPIPSLPQIGPPVTDQSYVANPAIGNKPDLFPIYYGYSWPTVVELTPTRMPQALPASLNDTGLIYVSNVQALRQLGYGESVAQAASFSKAHKLNTTHVYSNADIERLHTK